MKKQTTEIEMSVDAPQEEPTKALWAKCSKCGHIWAAAYYPINLELLAKIAKKHSNCPKCNGRGIVAKQNNGVLKETA